MYRLLYPLTFLSAAVIFASGQVIESKPCVDPNSPAVIQAAGRTEGECSAPATGCGSGCCRYYTAFLVCDDDGDVYPHQPCVCNENTADFPPPGPPNSPGNSPPGNSPPGGNPPRSPPCSPSPPVGLPIFTGINDSGSSSKKSKKSKRSKKQGGSPGSSSPPGNRSPPGPGTSCTPAPATPTPGSSAAATMPPSMGPMANECEFPTEWQTLGLFQNCTTSSDCDGVTVEHNGAQVSTCCKKAFCWCSEYTNEFECVD